MRENHNYIRRITSRFVACRLSAVGRRLVCPSLCGGGERRSSCAIDPGELSLESSLARPPEQRRLAHDRRGRWRFVRPSPLGYAAPFFFRLPIHLCAIGRSNRLICRLPVGCAAMRRRMDISASILTLPSHVILRLGDGELSCCRPRQNINGSTSDWLMSRLLSPSQVAAMGAWCHFERNWRIYP